MSTQFNSEDKRESISKELCALRLQRFCGLYITNIQALDKYLASFDKIHAMTLPADRTPDATTRLLQTGCTPSLLLVWLQFALYKMNRPFRPHTMRAAFYNAIYILEVNDQSEQHHPSLKLLTSPKPNTEPSATCDEQQIIVQYPNGENILFNGQPRFGRNPQSVSCHPHPSISNRRPINQNHGNNRPPQYCFNCERLYCTVKRCTQRNDFARIRRNHQSWLHSRHLPNHVRICDRPELIEVEVTNSLLESSAPIPEGCQRTTFCREIC